MIEDEEEEEMRSKYDYNKNKKQKRGHPNKGGSNNDRQFNHNSRDRGRRNHNNRRGGRRKKMSKEDKYIMNNQSELENELISFYNSNSQQQEKEISISNTTISSLIWYHKNVEIDYDLISQIVNWIHSESDTMIGEIDHHLEEMNEEKNNSTTEEDFPQSILVFLPGFNISFNLHCLVFFIGWEEIKRTKEAIEQNLSSSTLSQISILPLHSSLPMSQQRKIFEKDRSRKRKVILSTNIAETSLTISDVRFVIDSGRQKENRIDATLNLERLQLDWISRSSSNQRKGRCGRTKNGICFKLYPTHFYDQQFIQNSIPEIKRCNLENMILNIKHLVSFSAHFIDDEGDEGGVIEEEDRKKKKNDISTFLSQCLSPPSIDSINQSIATLETIGCLKSENDEVEENEMVEEGEESMMMMRRKVEIVEDRKGNEENEEEEEQDCFEYQPCSSSSFCTTTRYHLTSLGHLLIQYPLHPSISKLLILSSLFHCLDSILTIVSILNIGKPVFNLGFFF